jgi:hypothetical protein
MKKFARSFGVILGTLLCLICWLSEPGSAETQQQRMQRLQRQKQQQMQQQQRMRQQQMQQQRIRQQQLQQQRIRQQQLQQQQIHQQQIHQQQLQQQQKARVPARPTRPTVTPPVKAAKPPTRHTPAPGAASGQKRFVTPGRAVSPSRNTRYTPGWSKPATARTPTRHTPAPGAASGQKRFVTPGSAVSPSRNTRYTPGWSRPATAKTPTRYTPAPGAASGQKRFVTPAPSKPTTVKAPTRYTPAPGAASGQKKFVTPGWAVNDGKTVNIPGPSKSTTAKTPVKYKSTPGAASGQKKFVTPGWAVKDNKPGQTGGTSKPGIANNLTGRSGGPIPNGSNGYFINDKGQKVIVYKTSKGGVVGYTVTPGGAKIYQQPSKFPPENKITWTKLGTKSASAPTKTGTPTAGTTATGTGPRATGPAPPGSGGPTTRTGTAGRGPQPASTAGVTSRYPPGTSQPQPALPPQLFPTRPPFPPSGGSSAGATTPTTAPSYVTPSPATTSGPGTTPTSDTTAVSPAAAPTVPPTTSAPATTPTSGAGAGSSITTPTVPASTSAPATPPTSGAGADAPPVMPTGLTPNQQVIWQSSPANLQRAMNSTPRDQWDNLVQTPPQSLVNQFPPEAPPSGGGASSAPTTQNVSTLNGLQDDYRKKWDPRWSGLTTGDKVTNRQAELDQAIPKYINGLNGIEPGLGDQDIGELRKKRDAIIQRGLSGGEVSDEEVRMTRGIEKLDGLTREKQGLSEAIAANDRMQAALGNQGRSRTQGLPEPPKIMSPRGSSNAPVHTHLTEDQAGGGKSLITTPTSMSQDADGSATLYPVTRQAGDPPASIGALGKRDPTTGEWTKTWGLVTDSNKTPETRDLGGRDYYVTRTALENRKVGETALGHFPNPATTPFVVMHPSHDKYGVKPGDSVTVYNTKTGKVTYGVVGDKSGSDHNHIGEASLFTSAQHGNYQNPEASTAGNDTVYIFHAGSKSGDGIPTREAIQQRGRQQFEKWGGRERLEQMGYHPAAPSSTTTGSGAGP